MPPINRRGAGSSPARGSDIPKGLTNNPGFGKIPIRTTSLSQQSLDHRHVRSSVRVWIPMMVMGDSEFIVMAYSGT
jgi:hypothetical protein